MVAILVLSNQNLNINFAKKKLIPQTLGVLRVKISKVIIHFHGGAFISQSSSTHQSYTRRWSKELGVPFFSVDYRLAPKNPYPDPVNDAYQGYYWILTQANKHFGMDIDDVVIVGDSAGGELAVAVSLLAVLRNFKKPAGIVLPYPLCSSNINHFMPSSLLTIDDQLLQSNVMVYVATAFTKNGGDPTKNCILSPIYTPRFLLK
jgi:hormone-sensitive lipase